MVRYVADKVVMLIFTKGMLGVVVPHICRPLHIAAADRLDMMVRQLQELYIIVPSMSYYIYILHIVYIVYSTFD